jgi:hypothetical protein
MSKPRFGRRGAVLVLFSLIYAAYGAGLTAAAADNGRRPNGLELLTERLGIPLAWLALAWVGCAAVATIASLQRLPIPQWVGFTALFPMPALWVGSYLWSWLTWLTAHQGNPLGWAGALIWGLLMGLIGIAAGWPEAPKAVE